MPVILTTNIEDMDLSETYALDILRSGKKKPEEFYAGALGELAWSRYDGQNTYNGCVLHLRRAGTKNPDDWRYDVVCKKGRYVDVKSVGYNNVCQGFGNLLVTNPQPDVTYVLLHALGPSNRIFEWVGWMEGAKVATYPREPKAGKYVIVPKGELDLPSTW
jgi:hypothetical protein